MVDAVADLSLLARHAQAAGVEAHNHMVPRLQFHNLRSDLFDNASALVSVDGGERSGNGLFSRDQVGVADASTDYPDDYLICPWLVELDFFHRERARLLPHHRGLDIHLGYSWLLSRRRVQRLPVASCRRTMPSVPKAIAAAAAGMATRA
jgi:hypothetical protein